MSLLRIQTQNWWQPLHAAVFGAKNDDQNHDPEGDYTIFTSKQRRTDIIQLVLDRGADINPRDADGRTLLDITVELGATSLV